VFILAHYFATKSFAAVHEAFSNAFPDEEVLNMITVTGNKISGHGKCPCVFKKVVDITINLFFKFLLTNKN
jgi:hypothetical protein